MAIDYTHKDDLGLYVSDNIEAINTKISDFKKIMLHKLFMMILTSKNI